MQTLMENKPMENNDNILHTGDPVYSLNHLKFDFYNNSLDVVVQVYVKAVKQDSLNVTFRDDAFSLRFKTSSSDFWKLNRPSSEDTLFEWHVFLRHRVKSKLCKFKTSNGKITLVLRKQKNGMWNSLHSFTHFEGGSSKTNETSYSTMKSPNKIEHYNGEINSAEKSNSVNNECKKKSTTQNMGEVEDCESCLDNENMKENNRILNKSPAINHHSSNHLSQHDTCNGVETNMKLVNGTFTNEENRLCPDNDIDSSNDCISSRTRTTIDTDNEIVNDKRFRLKYDPNVQLCRPGFTGLTNTRNMCYINSIIQCLSSIQELRNYILSEKYCLDINKTSEHGFKGNLVICFASLIQKLWSGEKNCVSAEKLKDILGKRHKNFEHFGQGDAQEFLTFLLDGLHEDLKKNGKTKQKENIESGCYNVKNGMLHWEKFIHNNHSIFIDLFHGQTITEITCKHCKKTSLRFDPWIQLNLALPNEPKIVTVYMLFLEHSRKPLQIKVVITDATFCIDVLRQISKFTSVPANQIVLICCEYSRITHICDPTDDMSSIQIKYLIAYEIIPQERNSVADDGQCSDVCDEDISSDRILHIPVIQRSTHRLIKKCSFCSKENTNLKHCSRCCTVAYCNRDCQQNHWKRHRNSCTFQPDVIGCPFLLSIRASCATEAELKNKVLQYARYSVGVPDGDLDTSELCLRSLENITSIRSRGKIITRKEDGPVVCENTCLALDWESVIRNRRVKSKTMECDVHESVNTEEVPTEDRICSLKECLDLYWKPEVIRKETGWRCEHCKDVRSADRNVKVLRHPKFMIIDIKRFSYEGNGRKIRKNVSFPLRGLDMSSYSYGKMRCAAIYDLQAVCTHQGLMNFGHYVSYAKPYSQEELNTLELNSNDGWLCYNDTHVNCVSEDDIENTEAYILFYKRKEPNNNAEKVTRVSQSINSLDMSDSCGERNSQHKTDHPDDQFEFTNMRRNGNMDNSNVTETQCTNENATDNICEHILLEYELD